MVSCSYPLPEVQEQLGQGWSPMHGAEECPRPRCKLGALEQCGCRPCRWLLAICTVSGGGTVVGTGQGMLLLKGRDRVAPLTARHSEFPRL